jgi:Zinc carboxypeptidase
MKTLRNAAALGLAALSLLTIPGTATTGAAAPVAADDTTYQVCGRVFSDPHAFWPSSIQAPSRSPFAKGNAACAASDFVSHEDMLAGVTYLERLFPRFIEFHTLEQDFGDGSDCATSVSIDDLCSAGLPRQGVPMGRVKSDLHMIRVTDESVPDRGKRYFVFPLAIHGIERAGAEAGVRAAEDLATWAACEAKAAGPLVNCAQEGRMPHPLMETQAVSSVTAGDALRRSAIYFIFPNPDGWRRGDMSNLARFYQRYNGNGVDLNRDWPTLGYTFEPYTPWSEPETRGFGKVLKQIKRQWDGGIDLHGQLIDRAFSFTLLGASERNYAKNQRILQSVKGAWQDAEARLSWSPHIKRNDAPEDDPRMYGVQWGTVWDTIDYTVTGALGDWIDSPLGLNADGIDNEMSMSHISNCGIGSCYLHDFEQLHVDGNKSLIYAMVNYTLQPEDTTFRVPGKVAYVHNPKVLSNDGELLTVPRSRRLQPQTPIHGQLTPENSFTFQFEIEGPAQGVANGGVEAKATPVNAGGISGFSLTKLSLERYRFGEETPQDDGCNADDENWNLVNQYFNQSSIYLQAGQAVHGNMPAPGLYRVCLTGGLATQLAASGGVVELDITFSKQKAWEDPGQRPYSVTNMKFFEDLKRNMGRDQLVAVRADDVLSGAVDLSQFTSVVIADEALPGFTEAPRTGDAQPDQVYEPPTKAAATAPCAWPTNPVLPPSCYADYEFDVDPAFNNQQLSVRLSAPEAAENDWDLYVERQSKISGEWFQVGQSATSGGNESTTLLSPPAGHYRARIVNWAGTIPPTKLELDFSNEYAGAPIEPSQRTDADAQAWGAKLRTYAQGGGNLVLTDGAIRNVAHMGVVDRSLINNFSVYAGYIGFTRDGSTDTYDDPLAQNVDQPGAAEGPQHRHQTYEPVPIGYAIQDEAGADFNASPVWAVDQAAWEQAGGRTVGITTADQATLGELKLGSGSVRIIGALLPMPTEQYYHPFGLANYSLTYTGYQVLQNALTP